MAIVVPGMLLCDQKLTDSAKLLWIVHALYSRAQPGPIKPRMLEERSGFTRHTVLRGLSQLAATGWLPAAAPSSPVGQAAIPEDLVLERRLGTRAKLIYGAIQLTPGFHDGKGQFTYAQVACLTGMSHDTVKYAARALHQTGWLGASKKNKYSPIEFDLQNPAEAARWAEVEAAHARLEEARFTGEAIMREILTLIVCDREYIDNARTSNMVNPLTGQLLELDRYWPPDVAFEYNGSQHYEVTDLYPKQTELRKQMTRDLIKAAICQKHGITLVIVHEEDLSVQAMLQKVTGLLPLRNLEGHGPLVEYLDRTARAYREAAERKRKRRQGAR